MVSVMKNKQLNLYPLVPLRDIVLFPKMVSPLIVGRTKSIKAIEEVSASNSPILFVTQKSATVTDPKPEELHKVGVIAKVLQLLKLQDGTLKVLVEATERVKIENIISTKNHLEAIVSNFEEKAGDNIKTTALMRSVIAQFHEYAKLNTKTNSEVMQVLEKINDPGHFADIITTNLLIRIEDKQEVLEISNIKKRLEKLLELIGTEISILTTEQKIRTNVKKQMDKTHKEFFLNEQLKAIHKELNEGDDGKSELAELEKKISKTKMSKEAFKKAISELRKLKMMNAMSAEASVIRNYLEYLVSLPWNKYTKIKHDISAAQQILDHDHYGLDKVKERIIEYLTVQKRTSSNKGPILCLVGPPGVGKTSLAKSIAKATGRNYIRFSLGGVRDEAEIRGHRRTYVGAMPGKIISLLKKAESANSLILLDEIDKMSSDFRGDPGSALLEVLDPEQNNKFIDHYIEVEFDLSKVLFIATANSLNLPRPLLDRMEIIRLSGYTEEEKTQIAIQYLVKKICKEHHLSKKEFSITNESIRDVIRYYTRESGVRNLEREIAKLARKAVRLIEQKNIKSLNITSENLSTYAGVRKFDFGQSESENQVGVTTGLAYTEVGGDLLAIEAVLLPGKGLIKTTGKLGEVMQESAQTAFSYFKSTSLKYGIIPPQYSRKDIHLHVPEGATPKDGPSAGVAMFTSIVSVMTGITVDKTIAMTGEITLRGRVLPIGGLKEKLLAALRGGIKTVLIPAQNMKDLEDMPKNITENIEIVPIKTAEEAINRALTATFLPVEWSEINKIEPIIAKNDENDVVTH
jgi:ATP-dependent Lon protease